MYLTAMLISDQVCSRDIIYSEWIYIFIGISYGVFFIIENIPNLLKTVPKTYLENILIPTYHYVEFSALFLV